MNLLPKQILASWNNQEKSSLEPNRTIHTDSLICPHLKENRKPLIFYNLQLAISVVRWNVTIVPLLLELHFAKIYRVNGCIGLVGKATALVSCFFFTPRFPSCYEDEL